MIFVTVGTERFPFDRLVQAADSIGEKLKGKEGVFIQAGVSRYVPKHCTASPFLPYPETIQKIREARIIICHGGAGTILLCIQGDKTPFVISRRKIFGEHVNDHQVEFSKRMAELGYVHLAPGPEELISLVLKYDKENPVSPKVLRRKPPLAEALSSYLRDCQKEIGS